MSAPLGYNANASMLPSMSGTIHPMSGGSQSPYPEGTSAYSSLLPASPGPIIPFRGGVQNANAAAIAVAASAAAALSDPPVASEVVPVPVAPALSVVPALSVPMSSAASNEAAAAIAVAASAASASMPASVIPSPVQPIVQPASNEAAIAVAMSKASEAEAKAKEEVVPVVPVVPVNEKAKIVVTRETNPFAIAAVAAVSIKNKLDQSRDKEKDETKEIIVYGRKYHVTNPYDEKYKNVDNEGWTALLDMLHFNVFDEDTTRTIKEMIYDQPKCVEDNLPISSLIRCIPMRNIIQMIAYELLLSGKMDESSYSIHINFDDEKQAKAISTTKMELPIASPTALTPAAEKVVPAAGGARKARKRRVIRQHA